MNSFTLQEKLAYLPPYLLKELDDYLDFLVHKYRLLPAPVKPESGGLFGISRGEIKTIGDIVSPLDEEWEVLK